MSDPPANSSSNKPLDRLLEKQEEELESIGKQIQQWTKYKKDYQELKNLVYTMKDKVRHPYKIPISGSQLAFVKGHIIHTNEITVLLGYNYFALRSSKQADEIIERRIKHVDEMLTKSHEAQKKTQDWLKVAQDHKRDKEEFVEIIETG